MTSVDATYENGVLKPDHKLDLPERQRVRVMVHALDGKRPDKEAAFRRLLAGIGEMSFRSTGPFPTRDELHERD